MRLITLGPRAPRGPRRGSPAGVAHSPTRVRHTHRNRSKSACSSVFSLRRRLALFDNAFRVRRLLSLVLVWLLLLQTIVPSQSSQVPTTPNNKRTLSTSLLSDDRNPLSRLT